MSAIFEVKVLFFADIAEPVCKKKSNNFVQTLSFCVFLSVKKTGNDVIIYLLNHTQNVISGRIKRVKNL